MLKTYYMLTKPGIIMGNLITTIAGFALASSVYFNIPLFLETLVGLGLIIASACVCNNYIDKESDAKMARTKNRPLVKGLISEKKALIFSFVLGVTGSIILFFFTNLLALFTALLGFAIYVGLYSLVKYHTTYATLVGSISGAMPPVVGYVAVSNSLDLGALILFLILVLWQMPHFYAIAIYRCEDYKKANIPVLPVLKGAHTTKVHMLLYIIAFIPTLLLLTFLGYTGYAYLIIAGMLSFSWLVLSIKGFTTKNDVLWAKQMFALSLVIIVTFSLLVSYNLKLL